MSIPSSYGFHIPPDAELLAEGLEQGGSLRPIPASKPLFITCNYRKTSGALGGIFVGLKINGVAATDDEKVTSTLDQAENGLATWKVEAANPMGTRVAVMRWETNDVTGQAQGTGEGLGGTVTEVTIYGRVENAGIALTVSNLNVYSLPA